VIGFKFASFQKDRHAFQQLASALQSGDTNAAPGPVPGIHIF